MGIWIARNKDGTLEVYVEKPVRKKPCFEESQSGLYNGWIGNLDEALYPELTWENSPKELTIKEE